MLQRRTRYLSLLTAVRIVPSSFRFLLLAFSDDDFLPAADYPTYATGGGDGTVVASETVSRPWPPATLSAADAAVRPFISSLPLINVATRTLTKCFLVCCPSGHCSTEVVRPLSSFTNSSSPLSPLNPLG